ncbi:MULTISPECIES: hypothetical protein [unclassified Variovorax]|uniref:hypothetical protein n=1 Tax=unclassified Variovorax TaxID=663243 RepID=UPI00076CC32B|nr:MULTISPECIES: hypothetical protein [unclassified Variovorax]KWT98341.1 hypothetical protein APY03_0476 [Variovorax sp. WDL1]PNG49999.1 hypothetical protein CHC06_05580 [Variovorax sp. B2]PNG50871.1 hypothetical protein CHC07_05485 [Variovorax sp. B4]VTU41614.1 hypothetical protein H6P1_00008 [Variovorax sp. PBL-H6]VTU44687.1 hypothetical protein SRS16P1_00895 [Variovorax sp. SRS16]
MTAQTSLEIFEAQKKRHAALQQRRARVEERRDAEAANLERARTEAKQLLGTDDVGKLRELYANGVEENDKKIIATVQALDEIDQRLADIERLTATTR